MSEIYLITIKSTNNKNNLSWGYHSFIIGSSNRLRVDLDMLEVSPAFSKSICPLFTEEISERMGLDPHDYLFVFII